MLLACALPRDPEQTLERIRDRGEIHVGVTEHPPWARRTGDGADARGVEPYLVRALAERHRARIRWSWGSVEAHYAALERFELDLVIGGITDRTPWKKRIGLTAPYYESALHVGVPPGQPLPDGLDGLKVALSPDQHARRLLEQRGAHPVIAPHPFATWLPVLAADWDLRAHGYSPSGEPLERSRHVLAVPPGENAWLSEVERVVFAKVREVPSLIAAEGRP